MEYVCVRRRLSGRRSPRQVCTCRRSVPHDVGRIECSPAVVIASGVVFAVPVSVMTVPQTVDTPSAHPQTRCHHHQGTRSLSGLRVICSDEPFWASKLEVSDSVHPAVLFAMKSFCVFWVVRANPRESSCCLASNRRRLCMRDLLLLTRRFARLSSVRLCVTVMASGLRRFRPSLAVPLEPTDKAHKSARTTCERTRVRLTLKSGSHGIVGAVLCH